MGEGTMFRKMRREKKQMPTEEAILLLENCDYGVLSTISDDDFPYGVPLNYACKNGCIYFHSALNGLKIDNIARNNKVSFCVVGNSEIIPQKFDTKYKSVIVFGNVVEVFGEEKVDGLMALIHKYSKDFIESGREYVNKAKDTTRLYKINIEHLTGKTGE